MTCFSKLLEMHKNFVLIGETGSGKSEIALNIAVMLQQARKQSIHVFDLDQTKAMFRTRDAEQEMSSLGITVHYMPQLLDTPVLVNGIIPHLRRRDSACVLDVGGNENAARMIGSLSDELNGDSTAAIYVINPYRPWSDAVQPIRETMGSVLNACHLQRVFLVGNPTVGSTTAEEDVSRGVELLDRMIPLKEFSGVFIWEKLFPLRDAKPDTEYIPLHRYLRYPWSEADRCI